jgi:hypothetical protein
MPDLTEAFEQEGGVSYPKHFKFIFSW